MGAPTKTSPEPDLDAVDESWDADEPEPEDAPDDEVDSLEAGWGDPKRGRTAAEKARARDEKARLRAERQQARAVAIAQKRKPKQQKRRPSTPPAAAPAEATEDEAAVEKKAPEPMAPKRAAKSLSRPPAKDWLKMGIAVAIIVTLGLIALFVFGRT